MCIYVPETKFELLKIYMLCFQRMEYYNDR